MKEVAPEQTADLTAAPEAAEAELPPGVVAQTLGEFVRAYLARIRAGESGVLPVIAAMVAIMVVFTAISPNHVFLSPVNLVNLLQQAAVIMVLAMAEGFALVLGEIDLSVGYVGAIGGAITVQLVQPSTTNWHWIPAILAGLLVCVVFGLIQGTLITRLRLPSFIVTLAGFLIANGLFLAILLLGPFSGYPNLAGQGQNLQVVYDLMWGTIDPTISWIGAGVVVLGLGLVIWFSDSRRRRSGLVAPPASLSLIKIGLIAVVAVIVVAICNSNRANLGTLEGVPWFIPIVLVVLGAWTILLERTKFGRYMFAIGGNAEAARRAGINVSLVRTLAFGLCSFTAGAAMILYASLLGGMSNNVQGGQYVLYAVAAAVIGGTSLFGGRGKPLHGVLGGLVIAAIYNGLYLQGISSVEWQYIVTGLVLLAAVVIDAVSRRGASSGSVTRV
ncbi:MAG TPA: ABC transporter permease [Candidatus Dormibacteraeota bacterium]|jgi:D-xylose transport system permease protein|nr:ABC transporter permease [Candidatus Dormibacteraeota bacterium]